MPSLSLPEDRSAATALHLSKSMDMKDTEQPHRRQAKIDLCKRAKEHARHQLFRGETHLRKLMQTPHKPLRRPSSHQAAAASRHRPNKESARAPHQDTRLASGRVETSQMSSLETPRWCLCCFLASKRWGLLGSRPAPCSMVTPGDHGPGRGPQPAAFAAGAPAGSRNSSGRSPPALGTATCCRTLSARART